MLKITNQEAQPGREFYRSSIGGEVRLYEGTAQQAFHRRGLVAEGSIDLVLTDPPYIISRDTGFQSVGADGKLGGNPSFAISMDYGAWDRDEFTIEDLDQTVRDIARALKPGGAAIIFFDLWKISTLAQLMHVAGLEKVRMIEWQKTNAVPINSRSNYLSNAREVALVATKPGANPVFNSSRLDVEKRAGIFAYPIYSGPSGKGEQKIRAASRFHPTQKSLPLFEELIRIHSREGDVVLDCFSGSATTGVAAINTGRSYIGCEPDPEYYEKSVARLIDAIDKASSGAPPTALSANHQANCQIP